MKTFGCGTCRRRFRRLGNLTKHEATCSPCSICGRYFTRDRDRERHFRSCSRNYVGEQQPRIASHESLEQEIGHVSRNEDDLWESLLPPDNAQHENRATERNEHITSPPPPINAPQSIIDHLLSEGVDNEDEMRDVINNNWVSIRQFFKCHKIMDVMNVCLLDIEQSESIQTTVAKAFMRVWNESRWKAKVNASIGCILVHKTTGRYRYFHSSVNNGALFDKPKILSTSVEAEEFIENVNSLDLQDRAFRVRPNTEWRLFALTNMTFYFYKMIGISRAGCSAQLPTYIKCNRHVLSLLSDAKTGKRYDDKLCFFRSLAVLLDCPCGENKCKCSRPKNRTVKRLLRQYMDAKGITHVEFPGVDEGELIFLENCFNVAITVFELNEDRSSTVLWNSGKQDSQNGRLNLNLFANHFSYIRNISAFARDFRCGKCDAQFTRASSCRRHSCDVRDITNFTFPGGAFSAPRSLWDEVVEELGCSVPHHLLVTPYRATYDIESLLTKDNLPNATDTTCYENRHTLLSISVCSNVPGYTSPSCFVVSTSAEDCVRRFVNYLEIVSEKAEQLNLRRYCSVLKNVERIVRHRECKEEKYAEAKLSNPKHYAKRANNSNLEERIRDYLAILPVYGFNSQRYDLNVIKPHLMRILTEQNEESEEIVGRINFVVKKQDSMTCIQTASLRFLDTTNFIPPGYSYEAYLKAHGTSLTKGFFPYEWMDDISKLGYSKLPSQDAFYSQLTGKGISDEDYVDLQNIWKRLHMKTVKDLLVWYNNLDVEPFLEALQKQYSIYASRNIDMGRQAISLPGLAVLWMESVVGSRPTNRHHFDGNYADSDNYMQFYHSVVKSFRVQLIDEENRDLHKLFRDNLVGGPSIVFHRYHSKGETVIRPAENIENPQLCQIIQGYDANALYLYCIMQDMPVGRPIRRRSEDSFRPAPTKHISKTAQGWLAWMEFLSDVPIQTAVNDREARVGRHGLLVDGFSPSTNTVYQFHGCYWHGHGCNENACKTIGDRDAETRKKETREKEGYLKHLGYRLISVWECEWEKMVSDNPSLKTFLKAFFDATFGNRRAYTEEQLIDSIVNEDIFGFVECDIEVPPHLYDMFSEMSPIFKNVSLSRNDLSAHMSSFAEGNGFLKRPQRCLVGSMFAKKRLFLTTLLKWYIEHGLIVTRIYQIIQFHPLPIFKPFGDSVTEARRNGDVDPDLRLLANNAKLVGNSMYGKTIINKTTHRDTAYVADDKKVSAVVRSSRFHSLNILAEELYETTCFKKKHKLDEAIYVGSAILQLSKLRMLQFHYDLLDWSVDRRNYQMINMDTDSSYMALSNDLVKCVKPERLPAFLENYGSWFVEPFCGEHRQEFIRLHSSDTGVWKQHDCCKKHQLWDSRTPGKFKLEFTGQTILALNAKTYICSKDIETLKYLFPYPSVASPNTKIRVDAERLQNRSKVSSKGLSKRTNALSEEEFKSVLSTKQSVSGVNRGFVRKDNITYTYRQEKRGLTYFYGKRRVLDDGISTTYLDI